MRSRQFAFALQNSFVMSDIFPGWLPISLRLIGAPHPHNLQRTAKDNRKSWTSSLSEVLPRLAVFAHKGFVPRA